MNQTLIYSRMYSNSIENIIVKFILIFCVRSIIVTIFKICITTSIGLGIWFILNKFGADENRQKEALVTMCKEDAKFLMESAKEYNLFYAILMFTSVTGLIALLEKKSILFALLYFGLIFVLVISIWRCLALYREIINIEKSDAVSDSIKRYMSDGINHFIQWLYQKNMLNAF